MQHTVTLRIDEGEYLTVIMNESFLEDIFQEARRAQFSVIALVRGMWANAYGQTERSTNLACSYIDGQYVLRFLMHWKNNTWKATRDFYIPENYTPEKAYAIFRRNGYSEDELQARGYGELDILACLEAMDEFMVF